MQGLKELKVEGLELKACLLLSFGNTMASLTPPHPHFLPPPPSFVAPNSPAVSLDRSCLTLFLLHGRSSLPGLI